jgi:hypothetical protein
MGPRDFGFLPLLSQRSTDRSPVLVGSILANGAVPCPTSLPQDQDDTTEIAPETIHRDLILRPGLG